MRTFWSRCACISVVKSHIQRCMTALFIIYCIRICIVCSMRHCKVWCGHKLMKNDTIPVSQMHFSIFYSADFKWALFMNEHCDSIWLRHTKGCASANTHTQRKHYTCLWCGGAELTWESALSARCYTQTLSNPPWCSWCTRPCPCLWSLRRAGLWGSSGLAE